MSRLIFKSSCRSGISLLAVALFLAFAGQGLRAGVPGPGRVEKARLGSSIVGLSVYDWRGVYVRRGWGFFVNEEGHIVTTRSLLEGGFFVEATTVSRQSFMVKRVYSEDVEGNFIRLGLEFLPEQFHYLSKPAPLPAAGERVLVGGGTGCEPGAFLDGYIEGVRKVPLYGLLVKLAAPSADVGSPIFSEDGALVGVVLFKLEGVSASAWAVPAEIAARVMSGMASPADHLVWAEENRENWLDTPGAAYLTGLAYYWTGEYGEAIPRLMKATRDDRFRQEASFYLGCCNDALGRYGNAVKAYAMAVEWGYCTEETHLKLARACMLEGAYQRAVEETWAAIRLKSRSYQAFTLLGEIYNRMGNFPQALAGCYAALEINPEGAEAYHQLGVSLKGQQNYDGAIEALEKSIGIDPFLSNAYWDLALAFHERGDRVSAIRVCRALEAVDPELARQLLARVSP